MILDFGDKKRVTLEDLRIALPEVRILGITTSRKLGQAELAGHTIRNAIEAAGSSVLCAVFVGRGLKPNKTTRSIVSALNIRSTTAVQLRLRAEEDAEFHVQVESPDVWSLNSSRSSEWFEGRDLVAKQFVDYGVALAIIAGPILSNINENPSALSIADHYLLIVDSASSTKKSLSEAILLLESMERPVLGVLFIDR